MDTVLHQAALMRRLERLKRSNMKGTTIAGLLMLLAAASPTAFARLGESPQLIEERYGAPVSTGTVPGFTRCVYEKQSFAITVYFRNGISVLETFARRGLDLATARSLAAVVAARPIACPDPATESQIRQATGITSKDEVFWIWTTPVESTGAAFNPMECTVAFFNSPAVYASVRQALASDPLAGP